MGGGHVEWLAAGEAAAAAVVPVGAHDFEGDDTEGKIARVRQHIGHVDDEVCQVHPGR